MAATPAPETGDTAAPAGRRLLASGGREGLDSLLVSASLLAASLSGAGVALVLTLAGDSGKATDAILAAYSLYGIAALLVITGRSALVPLFGPADDEATFVPRAREAASRTVLIAAVAGLAVVVLAPLAGPLITRALGDEAQRKATFALLLFAPSVYLQGRAAVCAAVLTAVSRVRVTAAAYGLAAVVAVVAAVPLVLALGALGAPLAILLSSLALTAVQEVYLRGFDFTLELHPRFLRERAQWVLAGSLISLSMVGLTMQAQLALTLRALPGDSGSITAYVYAYFLIMALLSVTSVSASMVSLPGLVRGIASGDDNAAEEYIVRISVVSLAVVVPLLAGAAGFGLPVLNAIFSGSLAPAKIDLLYHVILVFIPLALLLTVAFIAMPVVLARGRERTLLFAAAVVIGSQLVADVLVSGRSLAPAIAQSAAGCLLALLVLVAATRRKAAETLGRVAVGSAPAVLLALPFVTGALLDPHGSAAVAVLGAAACTAVYAVAGALLWPSTLGMLPGAAALRRRLPARSR
jgi:peptidoglycan biosynthesis protein MviN/MurJ (putative lipid II flippase)